MFLRMKEKAKNLFKGKGQKEEPEDDPNNFENQLKEEQDLIRQDEIAKRDAAVQKAISALRELVSIICHPLHVVFEIKCC